MVVGICDRIHHTSSHSVGGGGGGGDGDGGDVVRLKIGVRVRW